jgi:two-component system chemotaxis sensor kinase CheA
VNKSNTNVKLTLRSKVLVVLAFTVIFVAAFVVYFSSTMIIKDKRSYLFDTSLTSIRNASSSMELFHQSKLRALEASSKSLNSMVIVQNDEDLYQIRKIKQEDLEGYVDNNVYKKNQLFLSQSELSKLNTSSEEYFLAHESQKSAIFTNKKILNSYKGRLSFLLPPEVLIKEKAAEVLKLKKNSNYIHTEPSRAPRLLYFMYDENENAVLVYDYFFDGFVEKFINQSNLETIFVSSDGQVIFNSRPQSFSKEHERFFKRQISKTQKETSPFLPSVSDYKMGEMSYIWASSGLKFFPGYYIFSGISTQAAYQVTTFLVLTMVFYVIILISVYGLISIFLSRSITRPLDKFITVIQSISNGQYGARVGVQNTTELQAMATTFNSMVDKIQEYNNKLIQYNRTLEQKVEERTQKLKTANVFITTMVNSLAQGFLVFQRKGICSDLYTKACEKLLGSSPVNKPLAPLIKAPNENLISTWIDSLFEEMIPFESLVEIGPKSIPCDLEFKHKDFKHITLEFFSMRGDDEKIENVVMVATDKTREYRAQQQVIEEQRYVKFVTKVLKDKRNFLRFVDLFEKSMTEAKMSIEAEAAVDTNSFMRLLHSMKGSASFYNLDDVVKSLHHFETDVLNSTLSPGQMAERIDSVMILLGEHLKRLKDFISENKESVLEIQEAKLRSFYLKLSAMSIPAAREFAHNFLMAPVRGYVEQYVTLIQDTAQNVGKNLHPLEIINGDLLVDMARFQSFFDSCIHVFRNAVDHGMEDPEERSRVGKSEKGQITIRFKNEDDHLIFEVQDDGMGINPSRIREKMKELNYPSEQVEESDERIIYHIFDPSFSTATKLTDLSGRGVGLYDVQQNLSNLGGAIEVLSVFGKGTVFRFYIPMV